jgi:hypothetical protein
MILEKINNVTKALRELGGKVSPEHYDVIRNVCAELDDASNSARHLESAVLVITIPVHTLNIH